MPSMFRSLARGATWDALVRTHGRLSTADDAITVGATSGSQSAVDAVWIEEEVDPRFFEDGKQEVRMGTLTLNPDDVSSLDTTWLAVIDSETWAVKRVQAKTPRLVLELVLHEEERVGGGNFYKDR